MSRSASCRPARITNTGHSDPLEGILPEGLALNVTVVAPVILAGEHGHPFRVESLGLVADSAGAGRHRGAPAQEVTYTALQNAMMSIFNLVLVLKANFPGAALLLRHERPFALQKQSGPSRP